MFLMICLSSKGCAVDSECNKKLNGGDTICLLAGTHELSDTAYGIMPHAQRLSKSATAEITDRAHSYPF